MESESLKECKTLENEITKGRDQVKGLKASSSGNEERVLERMLASYEEALSILKGITSEGQCQSVFSSSSDPPGSSMFLSNVQFEDSNNVSNASQDNRSQKRRPFPKFPTQFKETFQVTDGGLDDGYTWRKYGEKEILDCKYPRSYYRCTHLFSYGCTAKKRVQTSENDPSMFEVTYSGKHTCNSEAPGSPPRGISLDPSKMETSTNN